MQYFKDAELYEFLDQSNTKDEREIYKSLPEDSWLQKHRYPFFKVFEAHDPLFETLVEEVPLDQWAWVVNQCDRMECERWFQFLSPKQKFMVNDFRSRIKNPASGSEKALWSKKQIVDHLQWVEKRMENSQINPGEALVS